MVRRVAVVPHTHWDREWYLPFQAFRMGLVDMLDQFLPRLQSDPGYDRFLLDGQMAVVDDYLEMRPEARTALRRLAEAGRLTMGPWYILMDEFLVSGETIVRNLQMGLDRAEALGGAMAVGYLPDMFGHVAQMPQLLRLAGFEHAVVWRGVPSAVDRSAFWWQAPDGSTVRAEYLLGGYGAGAFLPPDGDALVRRVAAHDQATAAFTLDPDAAILWMNGTDHQAPQQWLGQVLAAANAGQDDYRFEVSSLPEYLAKAPVDGLASWSGELRSGARANLLMGVASNRVDIKVAAARAERALERVAEPLCALWLAPGTWPGAELALAWTEVIRNSAHDSICACSHDLVGAAVLHRFGEATAIAEGLRRRALAAAAAALPGAGPVVLNPTATTRNGVVEVVVTGDAPVAGGQVVESVAPGTMEVAGTGSHWEHLMAELEREGFRPRRADQLNLEVGDDEIVLSSVTAPEVGAADGRWVLAEAGAQAAAQPDKRLRILAQRAGWQRVAVHVPAVPGFGWAAWEAASLTVEPVVVTGASDTGAAAFGTGPAPIGGAATGTTAIGPSTGNAGSPTLANGRIAVVVDLDDGTWSITPRDQRMVAGLGLLVDDGDAGDTYNYSPPDGDVIVDRPESVAVEVIEAGPVRGRLRVTSHYRWPQRLVGGGRVGEQPVIVVTDLELRAGEDLLRVTMSFDNRCRDHRVRAWFPLPVATDRSHAECAFAVVARGLEAEGSAHEYGLATFPSRRFVSAGGLTVLHEGLLEYELVAEGRALALTLLRATGMLSRPVTRYRDNSAGPTTPLEGPQMPGWLSLRYALHVGGRDPYRLADDAWVPLEVVIGKGAGAEPCRGQRLDVRGAEVSALQRVSGGLEIRVFNPHDAATTVTIAGRRGWLVDLRGTQLESFDGAFPLRPWGIATVRLEEAPTYDPR